MHFPIEVQKKVKANNLIESSITPKILIIYLTFSAGKIMLNKSCWLVAKSIEIIVSVRNKPIAKYDFDLLNIMISSLY